MSTDTTRPCERQCTRCHEWKHHSRFRGRQRVTPHTTVWEFNAVCKDCEQIERNKAKNEDRPRAIVEGRAARAATKAGVPKQFFMVNMNYESLVPVLRAMMYDPGSICAGCGHDFLNERDIQFEHHEPPRGPQDWARLHRRNVDILCGSCNRTHGGKPFRPVA